MRLGTHPAGVATAPGAETPTDARARFACSTTTPLGVPVEPEV